MNDKNNLIDMQQRALANAEHSSQSAAPYAGRDNNELALELHETIKAFEAAEAAKLRKIEKIDEKYQPQIDELYANAKAMKEEIAKRIRAVGGKGMRTDDFVIRINQEPGRIVKNIDVLKRLETLLTPREYAEVYRQIPKTGYTEEFDTHALEDLRDFFGAATPIGKLITEGMYLESTPLHIEIEPQSVIGDAKAA